MLDLIVKNIFLISSAALLSVGRFYDERLEIFNINVTIIISVLYFISSLFLILKNRIIKISVLKFIFYLFLFSIILFTPINWIIYGFNDYGLNKYFSFILIVAPISYICIEVLKREDLKILLWILLGVSSMLLIIGLFNYDQISTFKGGRMTVMGGGPIVFSRWMLLGTIIILFHQNKFKKYLYLLIPLFLFMSFTAGSRGPIYSFIIVLLFYFLFSFRKNFFKIFIISLTALLSITTLSLTERNEGVGSQSTSRVFNVKTGSYARVDRVIRSVNLVKTSPLGVGFGNWSKESNKHSDHQHEDKEYPHNIFLELINESGIIVLLLFIILLICLIDSSLFMIYFNNQYNFIRLLFIIFVFLVLNSLVSGDMQDNRLIFVVLSMYISEKLRLDEQLEKL